MEEPGSAKYPNARTTAFKFVNYEHPDRVSNRKVRAQVRAHVSRWQHRQARARLGAAATKDASLAGDVCKNERSRTSDSSTSTSNSASKTETSVPPGGQRDKASQKTARSDSHQHRSQDDVEETLSTPEAYRLARGDTADAFSRGEMSFRVIALQDGQNVVGTSLHNLRLDLSSVMGLYENICKVQTGDFARLYSTTTVKAPSYGRFYSFVFTDPILLSTAVLLGVRNQLDILGRPLAGTVLTSVVHIERFLVRSISNALQDPVRGVSDALLIAVALCAAYEIKHGSGACYHVHMRGLVQMIHLRGGLGALGDSDPYIARLLVWIDTNTSKLAGCAPYLQGMETSVAARPEANTRIFRTKGIESSQ